MHNIKSTCPSCKKVVSATWKLYPVLLSCECGTKWRPRQDVLGAVYVYKTLKEKDMLASEAE